MIFRIPKGKHRARPLRFGLWWDRNVFTWRARFASSCRYDLGADQLDTNKLVGIGYIPHHHKDSARFGWRYDKGQDCIEIVAYCYVSGKRIINPIGHVAVGVLYNYELYVTSNAYYFYLYDDNDKSLGEAVVNHDHGKHLQYRLGPFFGGNNSAPHEMTIQIEKA